jgi:hypothetical protein
METGMSCRLWARFCAVTMTTSITDASSSWARPDCGNAPRANVLRASMFRAAAPFSRTSNPARNGRLCKRRNTLIFSLSVQAGRQPNIIIKYNFWNTSTILLEMD